MKGLKIGYARVSTTSKTSPRNLRRSPNSALATTASTSTKGLTGTNRARPGLREALAACRAGDQLVVTKLDRLARSVSDAHDIAKELTARLRGKAPKLSVKQEAHLVALHAAGEHTSAELAELFGVARSTVYRAIERATSSGVRPA